MPATVIEPTIVQVTVPGMPGPPGPPGAAVAATGATPPTPAVEGQIWHDSAGQLQVYRGGAWRGIVLDGQHF